MDMTFKLEPVGDVMVATVEPNRLLGDIVGEFRDALMGMADQDHDRILLDLDAVEYVDSSALSALVAFEGAYGEGEVHLCCVHSTVMDVMRLTKLDDLFPIHDTREDGLRALGAA